ncbi:MAG: polysaccharide biosynthesis protein [Deltaproteobacteria bacterium]|nr:polysaccharide biosynthesis protein [Deltaproteobacteria bacterium]
MKTTKKTERIWARVSSPQLLRTISMLTLDSAIAAFSLWMAYQLRFEAQVPLRFASLIPQLAVLLVASRLSANFMFNLHRWSFKLSGLYDAIRIGVAGLLGSGIFMICLYFLRIELTSFASGPPRSVLVMEFFITTTLMGAIRFSPRLAKMYRVEQALARNSSLERTLIVGAGATGEQLLRDLLRSDAHYYKVVGFVDDDRRKQGTYLSGRPVLGLIADLPAIVKRHEVGTILIAMPRVPAKRIREILATCSELKLRFKILPVSYVYLQDHSSRPALTDLSPEDLLPRQEVDLKESSIGEAIEGRCVMVTGAGGSIGGEICRQLLKNRVKTLFMLDTNENELYLRSRSFQGEFPSSRIVTSVADVRGLRRVERLFSEFRPQDVFHAAAHKHVPLMEAAPDEAVTNNVLGTYNVARMAHEYGAQRFVFISTDKAVKPSSVMGATKRIGEMVVRTIGKHSDTKFSVVRFGNVLGSAGSVVPLFRQQIAAGGPVTVTDPEVRRYFMTIGEAVGLVLQAAYRDFGELCILDMGEQIRILDLARHMITMAGFVPEKDVPIAFTGLRPGEKLYEQLMTEEEESTYRVDSKIFVACSPEPPADFVEVIEELIAVAERGEDEEVLALLKKLVPSYSPGGEGTPATRDDPI